jgi:hypothetical protein
MTCHALHTVPELALEIINDETVIREPVKVPFLLACHLGGESLQFCLAFRTCFDVVSMEDTVQVFMETVEQKYHELLRIMLIRIGKLRSKSTNRFLSPNLLNLS